MSSRRSMILIAAIAVGCIAAFVVLNYVGGIEDKANEDAERVPVLVVREAIPQGMPGEQAVEQHMIVEDEIAREFLPTTAIADFDQISGKVALNNLAQNQVLVDGMFVDPTTAQIGFGQRLEENHVATTISVDEIAGVAGLLVPGDLVDIFLVPDGSGQISEDSASGAVDSTFESARLIYHQARILAIGTNAAPQPGEEATTTADGEPAPAPAASGLITLDLPVSSAQLMLSLNSQGALSLALTGPDYVAEAIPPIEVSEVAELPGETSRSTRFGELTPYGPDGPQ